MTGGTPAAALADVSPGRGGERDVDLLRRLLAEVLAEQGGDTLAAELDGLHAACRRLREDPDGAARLARLMAGLPTPAAAPLVRACTMQLAIENIGDELRRLALARAEDVEGAPLAPESLAEAAERMRRGSGPSRLDIRLVLTAHPTDATRRSVLTKQRAVVHGLERLGDPRLGASERRRLEDEVREALAIWYGTHHVRSMRPRVADEVRRLLFFFESVLFDAAADLAVEVAEVLPTAGSPEEPSLCFGSWAGGDMDGNPNVGAQTISETLVAHRTLALRLLCDRVAPLRQALSQHASQLALGAALRASLERDERELPQTADALARRYPHEADEPLRRKIAFIAARLEHTLSRTTGDDAPEPGYASPAELQRDLQEIRDSLGSNIVARGRIEHLLWQVRVFGFHLTTLEVRANAPQLHEACCALLPGYASASCERQRVAALTAACLADSPPVAPRDLPREAAAMNAVADASGRFGAGAVDTFIISNAERASDVLCALWLARCSGLFDPGTSGGAPAASLDIVPLFERRSALDRGTETMAELYANVAYRLQLRARGGRQDVMLGYSDAGKDEGYLAAQWTMYRVQQELAGQAADRGVQLRLFHGRGGSPPRGGGPAYRAILAQPPGTVGGRMKVTEQGEAVTAKYSDRRLALRSLEQTVAAVVHATVDPPRDGDPAWRAHMDAVADAAHERYKELVDRDRDFLAFFRAMTPIDVLGELNIGSRPAARSDRSALSDLRAIPWVFSWMQTRVALPSWYGAGTGLDRGDIEMQREMWREWTFFRAVVTTLEVVLARVDLAIGERYLALVGDEAAADRLWRQLRGEHARCVNRILAITGRERLLDATPDALARWRRRLPWLDALSFLQVELLGRHRGGDPDARDPLLASVAGIATGLRATG